MLVLALACSSGPTWHADVKPLFDGRCNDCHTAGAIAPFALETYDEAAAVGTLIEEAVANQTMPPWGAEPGHRSYMDDPSLSDEQIATVLDWVAEGMPEGKEVEVEPVPSVGSTLERIDVELEMPEVYTPTNSPDDYHCFVIDWPLDAPTYVTGFRVDPGNPLIDHHVAAYLFSSENLLGDEVFEALDAWDEAEDGPGYTCFGGPSGEESLQVPIQQLAQWVPGMGDVPFAEGTGIYVPPGSKIVLQMHYWTELYPGESDQTGIDFMVEDAVDHAASFSPFLDIAWPGGDMKVTAGSEAVTHKAEGDPRGFFALLDDSLDLDAGFDIHSVLLHMHTLGKQGEVVLHKADGTEEVLVRLPAYDFNWQFIYRFEEPVRFEEGDELELRCVFDGSDLAEDANWGEGTEDEMCVANLYISELG